MVFAQAPKPEWQRTKPDIVVYIPKGAEAHDEDNEHFLVFPAPGGKELLAVWNQSSCEGRGDNRVVLARSGDGVKWSEPMFVRGARPGSKGRQASWPFPVVARSTGRIYLFYTKETDLTDGNPQGCGTMGCVLSDNDGHTWKDAPDVPMPRNEFDNPDPKVPKDWIVWQKPIRDRQGRYLAGYTQVVSPALQPAQVRKRWYQWSSRCLFMRFENVDDAPNSPDMRITWLPEDPKGLDIAHPNTGLSSCSEPSVVLLPDGRLFTTMRTWTGNIWYSVSTDDGHTWRKPEVMRYRDDGEPLLHPLSPCPIYGLQDGRFLLLYHDNAGQVRAFNQLDKNWKTNQLCFLRNPTFIAVGQFRSQAHQPIWFSQPQKILDSGGVVIGPKKTCEVGTYTSLTEWRGKRVLWYQTANTTRWANTCPTNYWRT